MRRTAALLALAPLCHPAARAADWPQWLGPRRDSVWREAGVVAKFPDGGPKTLWKAPVGIGYAGPAVAGGKVYVADRLLAGGAANPMNAFARTRVAGVERVLCLDAATGKEVWKHEYPCEYAISYPGGPRCTPTVDGDRVYSLGAMGDLVCLDAKTGKPLWAHNFIKEY